MKEFEKQVLEKLIAESRDIDFDIRAAVVDETVEFSGNGYFVKFTSSKLPLSRVVLDKPDLRGTLLGVDVGFLAFVENSELTLECYSYGEVVLPKHRNGQFDYDAT